MTLSHVFVESTAPTTASVHPCKLPESLQEGEILVHVVKLTITSNTITYALAGHMPILKYFQHFLVPADTPDAGKYARAPCWGTGVVVTSRCPEIAIGTRIHGLFPMSPVVALTPTKVTATQFVDSTPHRSKLLKPYLTYTLHEAEAFKGLSADEEDWQMGAGNLFSTGWSMAHTAAVHPTKPTALILTSASSRTSLAAAYAAKFDKLPLEIVGITSSANVDFVRGLDIYDSVCLYEDVASLTKQKVAILDVAGDASTQEALYRYFGGDIMYFGKVGMTHVQSEGPKTSAKGLAGAVPEQFLVFTAMQEIENVYGKGKVAQLLRDATTAYKKRMFPSFQPVRVFGPEQTLRIYEDMAQGKQKPECSYICSLWSKDLHEPKTASSKL